MLKFSKYTNTTEVIINYENRLMKQNYILRLHVNNKSTITNDFRILPIIHSAIIVTNITFSEIQTP